jgi:hypothetical protein
MAGGPAVAAEVAELVLALAGHVVAALALLHDHPALAALAVVQVVLQEVQLVLVAFAFVLLQVALCAVFFKAGAAGEPFVVQV